MIIEESRRVIYNVSIVESRHVIYNVNIVERRHVIYKVNMVTIFKKGKTKPFLLP